MAQKPILQQHLKFLNHSLTDIRILKTMLKNWLISVHLTIMSILQEELSLMKTELKYSISGSIKENLLKQFSMKNLPIIPG